MTTIQPKTRSDMWQLRAIVLSASPALIAGGVFIILAIHKGDISKSVYISYISIGIGYILGATLLMGLMIRPVSRLAGEGAMRFDQLFKELAPRVLIIQTAISGLYIFLSMIPEIRESLSLSVELHSPIDAIFVVSVLLLVFLTLPLSILAATIFKFVAKGSKNLDGDKMSGP